MEIVNEFNETLGIMLYELWVDGECQSVFTSYDDALDYYYKIF